MSLMTLGHAHVHVSAVAGAGLLSDLVSASGWDPAAVTLL